MALLPRRKRSSAATPSSTPGAWKKQLNTGGVSATTSAREPERETGRKLGREPGRPTTFTRGRREKAKSFDIVSLRWRQDALGVSAVLPRHWQPYLENETHR